jgi:hypothetical protein
MQTSYYDIDSILSEEELISVTNCFDFSHLAHLDPYYIPSRYSVSVDENIKIDISNLKNERINGGNMGQISSCSYILHKGTIFKMPLWSIENWVHSGFVKLTLPRHFSRKTRERIEADPVSIDLRNKNERFFMTGIKIVSLIKKTHPNLTQSPNTYSFERDVER